MDREGTTAIPGPAAGLSGVEEPRSPLVSAVLLNWNGGALAVDCLRHLLAQTYHPVEIIIVDNGSTDDSPAALAQLCPDAQWVRNPSNLGYAAGMNQGIALATGEYVLILNQDVLLDPGYLAVAVASLRQDPRLGMVGGQVRRLVDGRKTDALANPGLFLRKTLALVNSENSMDEERVFAPSGCCPLVRRVMLDDVALAPGAFFDEAYFAFGEDLDLWFRAHLRGWQCLYQPRAVAWHTHSGSLGGQVGLFDKPDFFQRQALKNRYLTMVKDLPAGLILWLSPWLALTEELLIWYVILRRPRSLGNLFWAWREAFRLLPDAWRQRRQIQARRTVDWQSLRPHFRGFRGPLA
jgi:GT2 family glycosyltransferase